MRRRTSGRGDLSAVVVCRTSQAPELSCGAWIFAQRGIDVIFQNVRGAKHENAPRIDRDFLARFRIAADATAFLADREAAEGRYFHHLAARERFRDFVENGLDEFRRLVTRQPNLLIYGLAELSPRNRLPRHALPPPLPKTLNRA